MDAARNASIMAHPLVSMSVDETVRKVLEGRRQHYDMMAQDEIDRRAQGEAGIVMSKGEIDSWRERGLIEARALEKQRETEQLVATNALGIQEQMQAESHREHERKLEVTRLEQEHEIAKLGTVDMAKETERQHELAKMQHDCELARVGGMLRGMVIGSGATLAIGSIVGVAMWLLI